MPNPISIPAGYAPAFAIGFSDHSGGLSMVNEGVPLPVTLAGGAPLAVQSVSPSAAAPLSGTASASAVAGPFAPVSGRAAVLTLSGTWAGTVQLLRSVDGGTTRHPVTLGGGAWGRFTANACEPVWSEEEADVQLYLAITLSSGTVNYRLAQ